MGYVIIAYCLCFPKAKVRDKRQTQKYSRLYSTRESTVRSNGSKISPLGYRMGTVNGAKCLEQLSLGAETITLVGILRYSLAILPF